MRSPADTNDRAYPQIDAFVDSLGSTLRERCAGVVLSGTGSDGKLRLKAIKQCGGLTIAQGHNGTVPQYGEMSSGCDCDWSGRPWCQSRKSRRL